MEFPELIQKRYSCRSYSPDPVPEDCLRRILEAARLAPTAANRQPFRIVVIHTHGRRDELQKIYPREWFVGAPLLVCLVGVPPEAWTRSDDGRRYLDVDAAIVMDHLILAAANEGLGTCWIAAFNAREARKALNLPDSVEPLLFTPIGYPLDTAAIKERKPLEDLVRWEKWT